MDPKNHPNHTNPRNCDLLGCYISRCVDMYLNPYQRLTGLEISILSLAVTKFDDFDLELKTETYMAHAIPKNGR